MLRDRLLRLTKAGMALVADLVIGLLWNKFIDFSLGDPPGIVVASGESVVGPAPPRVRSGLVMELIIVLLILESIVLESESPVVNWPLLLQIHRRLPDGLLQLAIGMSIELSLSWSWVSLVSRWVPNGPQVYLASSGSVWIC